MPSSTPPPTCGVAFKEWAGICHALTTGEQSMILRKGGIEEGPDGFRPEHSAFWLYPTRVHEGEQGLKSPVTEPVEFDPTTIAIDALAVVESVVRVDDLDRLLELDPFHAWTEATVRKRFAYRTPGLWVLLVRTFHRPGPLVLSVEPEWHGCKTWVSLPAPIATTGLVAVRDDRDAEQARVAILDRLGAGRTS